MSKLKFDPMAGEWRKVGMSKGEALYWGVAIGIAIVLAILVVA